MKTISKGLILALAIQFALVLPFENILGIKEAKAQEPGPVAPVDPNIHFVTNSTAQQVITIRVKDSSDWTLTFQTESIDVEDFYDNGQLPELEHGRPANDSDIIRKYKVTSPDISCDHQESTLDGGGFHYTSDIYLLTVKYTGRADTFLQSGMYRKSQRNQKLVKLIDDDMNNTNDYCGNISAPQKQVINLTRSRGYINTPIWLDIPEGERETRCNNMEMRWNNITSKMRDLTIPKPAAGTSTGLTGNANWRALTGASVDIKWLTFLRWVGSAFGAASYGVIFEETYADIEYAVDMEPTEGGEEKLQEIANLAKDIKTDIDMLKSAYPGDSWPDGCAQIKKFNWVERDEGFYGSLNEFSTDFEKIYDFFKFLIEQMDEPVSTGEIGVCGNAGVNISGGKIFPWLFCELASIIHGIAASIMTRATRWLTDSIGVDINMKFKDPAKDDYPTGGGGTETPTPGAGTPTPGTETPTPRTATPMNISGTINFLNRSEFDRAKNGGMSVKVKNGQAAGAIINVNAQMQFGNWDESEGKGSVSCRFTTTENIPADWTTITIYGERNNVVVMRTMLQYPPDPAAFVVQNVFAN